MIELGPKISSIPNQLEDTQYDKKIPLLKTYKKYRVTNLN